LKPEISALFTDKIQKKAAKLFGLDSDNIKSLDGFENFVCETTRGNEKYIIRISHSTHRDVNKIKAELHWVNYLAENGASVCVPLKSLNDSLVETLEVDGHQIFVVVFEKAKGGWVKKTDLTDSITINRGRQIGKIHALSKKYAPISDEIIRMNWFDEEDFANFEKYLLPDDKQVIKKIHEHFDFLKSIPRTKDNFGLIHMDAHTGNIFFNGEKPTLFDFDDCSYDFYLSDIAIPLFYAVLMPSDNMNTVEFGLKFLKHFIAGYKEETDFHNEWLELVPHILKRREMILYIAIHRGMDINNPGEWATKYLDGRKEKILNDVPYLDADFLSLAR